MLAVGVVHNGRIIAYSGEMVFEREILRLCPINGSKTEQKISGGYTFSFFSTQSLVFASVTRHEVDQTRPLQFLDDLSRRFGSMLGTKVYSATQHSLDSDFQRLFSKSINEFGTSLSKTEQIKNKLDQTQQVLQKSVAMAAERGDSLSLIQGKTEDLHAVSEEFLQQATTLKRKMRCSWIKSYAMQITIAIVAIYFLLSIICGGITLAPRCRGGN